MKKIFKYIVFGLSILSVTSCEDEWLERNPPNILVDEQVWSDPNMVEGVLSNFYDRLPAHVSLTAGSLDFAAYDEAVWSGFVNQNWLNNMPDYPANRWTYWDYGLIRDINLSISKLDEQGHALPAEQRASFLAELRFIRAYVYFELVKRMGGVPLVTQELIYDFSGDVVSLQFPRSREEQVYDFIAQELDEIAPDLGNAGSQTRANRYTALALKSRAMLYAGSIAKYNNQMGQPIATPGGEVGIPAERAEGYYRAALEAAKQVIGGPYTLYQSNPHPGENFYEAITKKTGNNEVIWAQDFSRSANKRHDFAQGNIPIQVRQENVGSSNLSPTLNLVEDFQYLDGSSGELKTRDENGDFIYYENQQDIFANKDGRMYGTVIYPGANFGGYQIEIQAGVMVWDEASQQLEKVPIPSTNVLGSTYTYEVDGETQVVTHVGAAGPHATMNEVSNTGFYLRKYVDNNPTAWTNEGSEVWWVRFRLGEMYLNAAEAAFELGEQGQAADFLNTLRARAGFETNLSSVTFDLIRNERRVELAFEDHIVWDMRRWRLAHERWDGSEASPNAVNYALYPYKVVRPGHPTDGSYVFEKIRAPKFVVPRFFQMRNYYSQIPSDVINRNPKIVRNPFH